MGGRRVWSVGLSAGEGPENCSRRRESSCCISTCCRDKIRSTERKQYRTQATETMHAPWAPRERVCLGVAIPKSVLVDGTQISAVCRSAHQITPNQGVESRNLCNWVEARRHLSCGRCAEADVVSFRASQVSKTKSVSPSPFDSTRAKPA